MKRSSLSLHSRIHDPSGPRRLRTSCAAKRGAPVAVHRAEPKARRRRSSGWRRSSCRRGGAARSSSASAPLSAAASESRRTATASMLPARISPITAPTARQRSASSIAHSRSRRCATRHCDQPLGREAEGIEAGAMRRAAFGARHVFGDPEQAASLFRPAMTKRAPERIRWLQRNGPPPMRQFHAALRA